MPFYHSAPVPKPGEIVRVRSRQYLTESVVPAPSARDATLVGLSCVDDDAQGEPLEVLWEAEPDAIILNEGTWDRIAKQGFDPPKLFSAYIHTLRWNCVTATDPKLFQAPFRAGIRIDAYQIEPLQKALRLPRVNMFIADDVGLGKTIEAGLIARELLLRKKVRDIVVACPPSVLPQWQSELEQRFGLGFEVLDREYMNRIRRERGYATNPWATHNRFLISHKLLIDEGYTGPLRDWLGSFRAGSLLILDEAHHAAPASGSKYAIDSKITQSVRDIAPRFEHRLFLSATPHNGHSNSFSALLEILDPQRFCRGVPVRDKKTLDAVMVRRLKEDIRAVQGGFPIREIVQVDISGLPADAPELKLSELLDEYRQLRESELKGESKRVQAAAGILISGLQQRLLSSIPAFGRTVRVHRTTLERQNRAKPAEVSLFGLVNQSPNADDDLATLDPDELAREEDNQIAAATSMAFSSAQTNALSLLDQMIKVVDSERGRPDGRVRKLIEWMREHQCPGVGLPSDQRREKRLWTKTRVIIFTEYEDTLRYLRDQLAEAIAGTDREEDRIALYRGSTPTSEREDIKRAFNSPPETNPLRILLCTDAAREGINLQTHCADLFHFDVPWNPGRMEQRNGRIDRKLQPADTVRCHYFVYTQRPEDRILAALVRKTEVIKKELGSLSQVIEGKLTDSLTRAGINRRNLAAMEAEIDQADLDVSSRETVSQELEAARDRQEDLTSRMDDLRDRLEKSREWVGLKEEEFRAAISAGLQLNGADSLKSGSRDGLFTFPALDAKAGSNADWAATLDTLRTPRTRDQSFWEWRRDSVIRPVVFDDPGSMTDSVVHLHLEHPVVKRLLGRFTAQGFVLHDLSRACFAQSADSIPRIVLLGRLCLYGPGAARLHEEIIPITARWTETKTRKNPLSPYASAAEGTTLNLLEQSLVKGVQPGSEVVLQKLQDSASQDIAELLPHLESRGKEIASDARKKLAARGAEEAKAMREVLEAQKKRIETTAKKRDEEFEITLFNKDEQRQLEADRTHWVRRLGELDRELREEPERIRNVYEVKAERIEPVGVVYLWPVTG